MLFCKCKDLQTLKGKSDTAFGTVSRATLLINLSDICKRFNEVAICVFGMPNHLTMEEFNVSWYIMSFLLMVSGRSVHDSSAG